MSTNKKGPFAGAPQEKASLKNYRALLAEIKALAPPKGCRWIDEPVRQLLRTAVNQAIAGEGRADVHVMLEVDAEALNRGWVPLRIEAGRWRFLICVRGWHLVFKDGYALLVKLDSAGDPIEEVRGLARDLGNARQARSLLTDGRAAAAGSLARASHAVWKTIGDVFQEGSNPQNWAYPIPPEAQIEGLWYAVVTEDPGDE